MRINILAAMLAITVGLCAVPGLAFAQAQKTDSYFQYEGMPSGTQLHQMFNVDIDNDHTTCSDTSKTTCEGETAMTSGDWSEAVQALGWTKMKAIYHEFGSGSGELKVWNCFPVVGVDNSMTRKDGTLSGASMPGTEAPGVPTEDGGEADPMCVDLTAGAGVTMIGTTAGVIEFTPAEQPLGFIVFEMQTCTADCDAVALLLLTK